MVVTTTTAANGKFKSHAGTLQEILDAIEGDAPRVQVETVFHDGTNYVGIVRLP